MIEQEHQEWLEARGISADLAAKFGLKTAAVLFPPEPESDSDKWVKRKAVAIPYYRAGKVFNHKYRRTAVKQHVMDKGAPLGLWNEEALDRAAGGTWVLTEGEWDGLVAEDLGWAASSVPNGANDKVSEDVANAKRYAFLWDVKDKIAKVDRIILATDSDVAGVCLRTDLIALFGPVKCSYLVYPEGCKDLTDVRVKHGVEAASKCLLDAKPVPVKGLYKLSDFPAQAELEMLPIDIDGISFKGCKDNLWGLVPTTTTMVTGYPGQGKSSLVLKMVANLILQEVPITLGSFETIIPVLERKILACMCSMNEHDPFIWKRHREREMLEAYLNLIATTPDDEHEIDLDYLMDLLATSHARFGARLNLIDPWNELEHKRQRDESETDYTGRAIRTLKRFAHSTRTATWIVAHPRKPSTDGMPKHPPSLYDLAGSANWYNKADYGLVVHRPDLMANEIDVMIPKVRMGLPGRVGRVTLTYQSGRSSYGLVACD